jgi:hypothetical protein
MPNYLDILLGKAYESMEGELYNRYREKDEERGKEKILYYEVSLMQERPWDYLRDRVYPAFARYLRDKSLDPETAREWLWLSSTARDAISSGGRIS